MPRFLDTSTGVFVWVEDPSSIVYAILSHTWRSKEEGGEQSGMQVEELRKRIRQEARASTQLNVDSESILSHPELSDKIKGICDVARKAGYKYVWIDSCCIDKTSSAELAEAINSMFDLYRLATVCFVYLSDVPDGTRVQDKESSFAKSRWHTRGWTLQELIAPARVVFLSSQWNLLGTKVGLAATLQKITGIDVALLTGRASLDSFSVARRMSWAAGRETTRVEDEAYSLLGIFGVHLSPIYGEGRHAFLRLQEEIIKNIPDQSIFAWGSSITLTLLDGPPGSYRNHRSSREPTGLLAPSPSAFSNSDDVEPLSPEDFLSCLVGEAKSAGFDQQGFAVPLLHCMFTPEGVRLDVLCIDLAQYPKISDIAIRYTEHNTWLDAHAVDHCLQRGRTRSLAVLRCKDGVGRLMAIPLFHPTSSSSNATSSSGKQHGVSIATHMRCSSSCAGNPSFRLIRLSAFALETIRDRHLLSRQPATVFFLHNSGSEFFSALPALRSNYIDLSEKLWDKRSMTRSGPSDSDSESPQPSTPSQRVQLAPACEEELLLLGFQVSPLTFVCSRGQNEVLVETVLSSGLLEGTSREPFRQHIRIKLVISRPAGVFGSLRLQLSVANNFHFPPEQDHTGLEGDVQEGSPIDLWKIAAADICAFDFQPPLCTIVDAPSADSASRDGSRTLSVSQYVTKTRRTIVRTQHIIHGYWNRQYTRWMHLPDKHVVRDMRLALECPWEAFDENASPGTPVLWLSVELSEAYRMASDVRLQLESRDTW